ncbi:MAG: zinc-ribbon and DUF3426 domain-containing protein [Chromatiales bacterium]|jgi:predicted Zn finger-like uncharacterized protein
MTKERIICPNCGASYRITVKMLQKAGQEARCAVCKKVFTIDVEDVEFSPDNPELSAENVIRQLRAAQKREQDREQTGSHDPESDAASAAPASVPVDSQPQWELIDAQLEDDQAGKSPEDKPDASAHHRLLSADRQNGPAPARHPQLWLAGIMLLALALPAQGIWLLRETPFVYTKMIAACEILGCTPPQVRSPESIRIVDRLFTAIDGQPGTYQLQLNLLNEAPWPQPFPTIELSLLDSKGIALARNRFDVDQYLGNNTAHILEPGVTTNITFRVRSPLADTSGFMLEFL